MLSFFRGFLTFKGRVEILKSFYPGTGSGVTPDYAVIITDPCQKELPAFYAQSLIRWEPLKWALWNLCWSHSWVSRFLESEVFFAITIKHQIFGKAIYWGRGPTCVCKREWALCVLDSKRQNVVIGMQASCFAFSLENGVPPPPSPSSVLETELCALQQCICLSFGLRWDWLVDHPGGRYKDSAGVRFLIPLFPSLANWTEGFYSLSKY